VELTWILAADASPHAAERLLPDGSAELVISLLEPAGVLIGPQAASFPIGTARSVEVIGAHFRPGGVFPFLRAPAGELHGAVIPFDDVWKRDAASLRERLLQETGPAARFSILEGFLLDQAVHPLRWDPAVSWSLREFDATHGAARIARVIERTGRSHRGFIARFRDQVGLPPKIYCRLRRFQRALRLLESGRGIDIDLAGLALDCGYYDQAHFNHDFSEFAGTSPTAFLRRWDGRHNHLPA